jgi:hypothetical protein
MNEIGPHAQPAGEHAPPHHQNKHKTSKSNTAGADTGFYGRAQRGHTQWKCHPCFSSPHLCPAAATGPERRCTAAREDATASKSNTVSTHTALRGQRRRDITILAKSPSSALKPVASLYEPLDNNIGNQIKTVSACCWPLVIRYFSRFRAVNDDVAALMMV